MWHILAWFVFLISHALHLLTSSYLGSVGKGIFNEFVKTVYIGLQSFISFLVSLYIYACILAVKLFMGHINISFYRHAKDFVASMQVELLQFLQLKFLACYPAVQNHLKSPVVHGSA